MSDWNMNIPLRFAALSLCLCAVGAMAEIHVPEADAKRAATEKPAPLLTPVARQLNLKGRVELTVSIDAEGNVSDVKVTSGNPVLAGCAVAAVKKWKFQPFTENGKADAAVAVLSFEFKQ